MGDPARELFDEVTQDMVFVERVAQRIRKEVQSYGLLSLEQILDVGADWSRVEPGTDEFREHFYRSGYTRAQQGVPASDMLLAYRVFHQEMRRRARELSGGPGSERDALLAFLELSAAYVDEATMDTTAGHHAAELTLTRRAFHDREAVVRRALFGGTSAGELRTHLEALGVDMSQPFRAVRARSSDDRDLSQLERILLGGIAHRGVLALVDGDLCGFVATLPTVTPPVLVGVSGPVGLLDLPAAFALASRALTTATALERSPGFHDLASVGLHAAVLSDHELGDLLVARYVEPLEAQGEAGRTVLATVALYLENDSRLEITAKQLWVHVNTVRYRITRFQETTGASLKSTSDLVEVWWALARRRAGGS
ncbi:MAG: helix-turn-helix domain-containing protein [Pseudonocardia sp.]|uniref:PucR family transcriptional regulator n=1 Tax=unclassified Pseudonocardia TaxID=2619320 RepID=UPI0008684A11|nr:MULTISPECIES: helix-turn-helix domain-containing protein [unclassified Pseudonocardia]MBN9109350.1 helix-turn-helix domain-containing protein [Pseudonocardia sp.]ODU29510.1 MAG: hypothetical protein ABS80_01780 [Pseudonocardia sp. SCN 72-51]ODV08063.1 MAG: hypothetical protein ABT15_05060 [Pseudonocardia sp. SCN 73-27]